MHVALLALALRCGFAFVGSDLGHRLSSSVLLLEIALDLRRSQKLLDPFRFVESLVDAEADVGCEFQVDVARDLAAQEALVALERREHRVRVASAERHHVDRGEPQVGASC